MEYYIYITNSCNMNCTYCSVMMDAGKAHIPMEINYALSDLKNFITKTQLSRKSIDNTAILYFFGGEPTLHYEKISQIIQMFSDVTEFNITYVLHTNGLLLEKIPAYIISHINVIFLSLNYEKIFVNGKMTSYFSKIIDSITQIKKKYNIVTLGRLTISPNTSLYMEATMTGLFFDYIYWQLDNQKEISKIEEYKRSYIKEVTLLYKNWLSFLRKGTIIAYVPFLAIIRHIIYDDINPTNFYCGYGDDIVYIQTDGICHGCCDEIDKGRHIVGNIYDGIKFVDMEINTSYCKQCQHLRICGGRCGRMHKDFTRERIQHFCDMNIHLFTLIKDSINEIKELMSKYPYLIDAINDTNLDYTEQIP